MPTMASKHRWTGVTGGRSAGGVRSSPWTTVSGL